MASVRFWCGAAAVLLVLAASPLPSPAQGILGGLTGRSPIQLSLYGGSLRFSEMGEVEAAFFPAGSGSTPARVTNLELTTESAPAFGVAIGWSISRSLGLRLNGAFAATEFDLAGVSAAPGQALSDFRTVGGLADVLVTLVGLDLLWRLAAPGRVLSPYAVAGVGAAIWDLNALNDFQTVEPLTGVGLTPGPRTEIEPAASLGLGADLRLGGRAALRVEVANHIGRNPVRNAFETGPDFTGTADTEELVHAVRLSAGISMDLGERAERRRRPGPRPRRR